MNLRISSAYEGIIILANSRGGSRIRKEKLLHRVTLLDDSRG